MNKNNQPKISIIIPIYNVEKYIHRCIESIRNQTLKDIEIILVDDESPDNCPKICDEYLSIDNRIKVIHKKNEGLGMARNSGLDIATGQYVAFVDSDDFVDIIMYEILYKYATQKNLDACYSGIQKYFDNGRTIPFKEFSEKHHFSSPQKINWFLFIMFGKNKEQSFEMSACRAIYSRKLLEKYNIRFISERIAASEDLIFHIDFLTKAESIYVIPDYFYNYYCNTNSITTSYSEEKYNRLIKLLQFSKEKLAHYYKEDEKYLPYYYCGVLRIFKVILKFESLANLPFKLKVKILKEHLSNSLFQEMVNHKGFYQKVYLYDKFLCLLYKLKFYHILMCIQSFRNIINK